LLNMELDKMTDKMTALAKHLEVSEEEAEDHVSDYLVLTDEEADERVKENILESLWAFNKSFLNCHSEAIAEIPDKEFVDMQGTLCESFNKAIHAMIDDIDHFIKDAILSDGRGHFLSSYDGAENEIEVNGTYYYIYREN